LLDGEAALDLGGRGLGEGGHAGVALLLAPVPLTVVAVRVQDLGGELVGLGLGLLQADHVGLLALEPLAEALLPCGADAVDVPRDQFHGFSGADTRGAWEARRPSRPRPARAT